MVAILILVGKGQEDAEIVQRMLDIDTFGNKPQYNFADEVRAQSASDHQSAIFRRYNIT